MENKITFDPKKSYQWEKTAEIKISGEQFAYIVNITQALTQTEMFQAAKAIEALDVNVKSIIKDCVESGLMTEKTIEEPIEN